MSEKEGHVQPHASIYNVSSDTESINLKLYFVIRQTGTSISLRCVVIFIYRLRPVKEG